jgi:hypothetical protein
MRINKKTFQIDPMVRRLTAYNESPRTWEQATRLVLGQLAIEPTYKGLLEMSEMERIELFDQGHIDDLAIHALYDLKLEGISNISLVRLYSGKQSDYGPRNILRFGDDGLQVRLWDKIARLNNLDGRAASNESVQDTLKDIVGYVVIAIMLRLGWFELPLRKDLK